MPAPPYEHGNGGEMMLTGASALRMAVLGVLTRLPRYRPLRIVAGWSRSPAERVMMGLALCTLDLCAMVFARNVMFAGPMATYTAIVAGLSRLFFLANAAIVGTSVSELRRAARLPQQAVQ